MNIAWHVLLAIEGRVQTRKQKTELRGRLVLREDIVLVVEDLSDRDFTILHESWHT